MLLQLSKRSILITSSHFRYKSQIKFLFVKSALFWGISVHFSPIILTLPQEQKLGHTKTGSRPCIPVVTLCVSLPPPPLPLAVLILSSSNLFICILIFTVGLFVIYLSSFILMFSSSTVTLFHICFSSCLSCLHSPYPWQLYVVCIHPSLTLVLPYWLSSHLRIATLPYFPESTYRLLAFFPTQTLDPWRWDRYVVPKRR
jgi:hypothetical protein